MGKILTIVGPTASGKTKIGIRLADIFNGEIVSCDSRQVYRLLNIGTAKPTKIEQAEAVHHLIDLVNPDEKFTAAQYGEKAGEVIEDIINREKTPIIVGGSGLYLKALERGFFAGPGENTKIREKLKKEKEKLGKQHLYNRLKEIDEESASKIHPNDEVRITRALEVYELTGKPISYWQKSGEYKKLKYKLVKFGLNWERKKLYERINQRVDQMIESGLLDEVKNIQKRGYSEKLTALNTFGYKEIFSYLKGEISLEKGIELIKQHTRNYAKRQLTWFRADKEIIWIDMEKGNPVEEIRRRFVGN
jgi:tRNA dimethylallyltransferase